MSASKVKVLTTDKVYLDKNKIDLINYSEEIQQMISNTDFEKYKFCNCCGKYYPFHSNFFMKEKRQKDGYENKCRLCRNGRFAITVEGESILINVFQIDNDRTVIENYINFLNSDATKTSNASFLKNNTKEILNYLIMNMSDEDIYNISRDWIKSKKLYGLSIHSYNGSIAHMFHKLYTDRFMPWNFTTVGKDYWTKEENRNYAFDWFINKLKTDDIIECEDDLLILPLGKVMTKYRLLGLYKYYDSKIELINNFYPTKYTEYDLTLIKHYKTKDDIKQIVMNHVYNELGITVENIKYKLSHHMLLESEIRKVLRTHLYNGTFESYHEMLEYCFDGLDIEEYKEYNHKNYYKCYDGKIAKSSEERELYYMIKDLGYNVDICNEYNKQYRLDDELTDTIYYPDFMIYGERYIIIVEYYGYMSDSIKYNTFAKDIGYLAKHDGKVDYYTNRLDKNKYRYLGLYPNDIRRDNKDSIDSKIQDVVNQL